MYVRVVPSSLPGRVHAPVTIQGFHGRGRFTRRPKRPSPRAMDRHSPRPLTRTYAYDGDKIRCVERDRWQLLRGGLGACEDRESERRSLTVGVSRRRRSLSEFRDALMRRKLAEMEKSAKKEKSKEDPSAKGEKQDESSALEREREKLVARKRQVKASARLAKKRLEELESKRHALVVELKKVLAEEERAKKRASESEDGELPQAFFNSSNAPSALIPSNSAPPSVLSSGARNADNRTHRDSPPRPQQEMHPLPRPGAYYK